MKSTRYTAGLVLLLVFACAVSSCRPRASRTRQQQTPTQTHTPSATPSAAELMAKTDSVISRVGEMASEESDIPLASDEDIPRTASGAAYVPTPENDDYTVYEAALGAFNGNDFERAIGLLSQMVVSGRPPELIPNAYYWMGESYFAMDRFLETLPYFEHTVKVGPQHKREIAMYKLARANHELGNQQAASLWYQRLRAEYPKTSYASRLRKLGIS